MNDPVFFNQSVGFDHASNSHYVGSGELWQNERYLLNYNRYTVSLLSAYIPPHGNVLEFGAGIGTLAMLWEGLNGKKPDCVEIDPELRAVINSRLLTCYAALKDINRRYDGVYTSNVLEHIEDDVTALRDLKLVLKPGGTLAIYVPAFMCLYSGLDRSVGHYRRYTKSELVDKLSSAGYRIVASQYVDSIGFLASLALRFIGYKGNAGLGGTKSLIFYDKYLHPLSCILDRLGCRYLFGKNLLIVAQSPTKE